MTASSQHRGEPVDQLIAAAVAVADHDLERAAPRPDFAGLVARAHRLDPAAVPARWLAAGDPRPVWPVADPRHTAVAADDVPRADPRRKWLVLALAAAAVLAFAVQHGLARRDADDASAFQADAQPDPAAQLRTRPDVDRPAPSAVEVPAPEPASPPANGAPTPADPTTRGPATAATRPTATREPPRERLEDLLARLDDEAEACMQAGDLACADARYAEIVQRGGRRVQVELAFSDRFQLARRRRDDAGLRAQWTAYLARFPRGRFADDARGGLCRAADDGVRAACWRDYLEDFPAGAFRDEAGAPR